MMKAKFSGRILVLGYGSVSRCTLPLLLKHLDIDPQRLTVMDYANPETYGAAVRELGCKFVAEEIQRPTMGKQLSGYLKRGDILIDLAWNIGCNDILQWCHDHEVRYVNTSVEVWDPYANADTLPPQDRTLYARHMTMRKMIAGWKNRRGATAVLDHGANPGLVSHFTKQALADIATRWLEDHKKKDARREHLQHALSHKQWNHLAHGLGVKVIHISERDTQVSDQPKRLNEFVNTWSIEGFFEEGTSPAEMGWGTHEKRLPAGAAVHLHGPGNQICLSTLGVRTWVRSWVPNEEIVGMVIRHGEAFSLSEYLTVHDAHLTDKPIYRPTVHYAYHPCDAAIVSLHELMMRNYELQPKLRIMGDEIIEGQDKLGCLLMGHAYKSWWIGSLLDIHEARELAPGQNATTLQVACSVLAAVQWMIENPNEGVCLPDQLPHDFVLKHARPYLGKFVSDAVNWTPLDNWDSEFAPYRGVPKPDPEDAWQFSTFLSRGMA